MTLITLGFFAAALGTLIGVGGGFLMVPALLFLYPEATHIWVTAISLWLVALNTSSGSVTYFLKGKVHLRAALVFIFASLPGSVLGVWFERFVSRDHFELIFGVAMMAYAIYLFLKKPNKNERTDFHARSELTKAKYIQGAWISFFVGFVASLLGIGGGVIHVPLLAHALDFPVHMATGTSHFILACTALFATATHLFNGDIDIKDPVLWQLGGAAILGAQLGAYLGPKVPGKVILKTLSVVLFCVGVRLVLMNLHGFS